MNTTILLPDSIFEQVEKNEQKKSNTFGDFINKIRYNMGYRPYNEVTAKACEDARNGISAGRVDTSSFEAFLHSVLDD
jgi:hypothetical protein